MKITEHNYESFFLDYLEGKLSERDKQELHAFLQTHPDLLAELTEFETIPLVPDVHVRFPFKQTLQKADIVPVDDIHETNYEENCIAYYEQDLTQDQTKELLRFVEYNPSIQRDFRLFGLLKIHADKSVIFSRKQTLKKTVFLPVLTRKYIIYTTAVAACIAALIMLSLPVLRESTSVIPVAQQRRSNAIALHNTRYLIPVAKTQSEHLPETSRLQQKVETPVYRGTMDAGYLSIRKTEYIDDIALNEITTSRSTGEFTDIYYALASKQSNDSRDLNNRADDLPLVSPLQKYALVARYKFRATGERLFGVNTATFARYGVSELNKFTNNSFDIQLKLGDDGKINKMTIRDFAIAF